MWFLVNGSCYCTLSLNKRRKLNYCVITEETVALGPGDSSLLHACKGATVGGQAVIKQTHRKTCGRTGKRVRATKAQFSEQRDVYIKSGGNGKLLRCGRRGF